ncbi:MAG: hypothetical protein ACFFE8_03585 [Candidatus Heimdallarchaeota archaeon]
MAFKPIYRTIWQPREVRTLVFSILLVTMAVLLELIFIFFAAELQASWLAFLYIEIDLPIGIIKPFEMFLHLILWGIMFFCSFLAYSVIREYANARVNLVEILVIGGFFVVLGWLIFELVFGLLLAGVIALILGYMYFSLAETP